MHIISFGWSWPPFVARQKSVTRRHWKDSHAAKFKRGVRFVALDRDQRYGGQRIGEGVIVSVTRELLRYMPDDDYEAEGFAYLLANPSLVPPAARKRPWGDCTRASFLAWREQQGNHESFHVVRFEITSVDRSAEDRIAELLRDSNQKD